MIVDCLSDLHGHLPKLAGGDLLIIAGDLTAHHTEREFMDLCRWIAKQKYRKKVLVAGNHDTMLDAALPYPALCALELACDYLLDSGTEFEGLKIWGSPWTLEFLGEHPDCKAFTCKDEEGLAKHFNRIPRDTNILITHSPPRSFLDRTLEGKHVGSRELKTALEGLKGLKLHVFGHVHEAQGQEQAGGLTLVNASLVNRELEMVNKPTTLELKWPG
jgi:predicted phosphodiesterase